MRIALLHYTYLPTVGGVEIVVAQQARLFSNHGHEVTVICRSGASNDPRIRVATFASRCPSGAVDAAAEIANVRDALRELMAQQDVVLAHNVCTMPFDLALTAAVWDLADELPQVRFVCWTHDIAAANPDLGISPASLPPALFGRAHPRMEYVAVSDLRAQQLTSLLSLSPEHCRIIPNGIDPETTLGLSASVSAFAQRHRLLERDIVLFQPARLLRRKNVELGLRVTAGLRAAGRDCAVVVTAPPDAHNAASADYAASLVRRRAELALEQHALFVHEHFTATDRDVASLYAVADALFFPSRQEGFGLPLLEAALHRLPIFCADIEPLRSMLDPRISFFSPVADPAHIAAALMRQLDASGPMQIRKTVARHFTWPAIYRKFLAPFLAETKTLPRP